MSTHLQTAEAASLYVAPATLKSKRYKSLRLSFLLSILLAGFFSGVVSAQSNGIYESYAILSINGGVNTYYDMNAATANPDFNGGFLGNFNATNSLVVKGGQNKTFKCNGGDIFNGHLNWRVWRTSLGPSGSFNVISMGFISNDAGGCGGNQTWQGTGGVTNLLSSLSVSGNYTLEVYSDADGIPGTTYSSNGGANYRANFNYSACSPSTAAVISGTTSICPGGQANLVVNITGGTSPFSVIYNDGVSNATVNNYISGSAIPVSPSATKTYTLVSVTSTNGCAGTGNTGQAIVTVNPSASLSLTSILGTDAQTVCSGASVTPVTYAVGGATGASATGLPAGVNGVFNAGVFTISGTPTAAAGTYNYTVTTSGGCGVATANGSITINGALSATYVKTNLTACNVSPDGTITVTPTGGSGSYTYSWTGVTGSGNPASTPFSAGNVSSLTGLNYGFYNVTITDNGGCGSITLSNIHVEFAYSVYVTNSGTSSSSCGNTGSIILYGNAGVTPYTYSLNGTSYQVSNTFTGLAAGTYTAYVKDAGGCVSTKSITVGSIAPVTVSPFTRAASSCANDGSIEVYRSGGTPPYTYSKDGTTYQSGNTFTGLAAGTYTVYVKDAQGCIGSASAVVAQGAALTVTANKSNTSTCVTDGSIQVNVTGGVAPFTYSKDNGVTFQSGNTFTGLAAGNYVIVVKDSKNCTGTLNVTINLNPITVTSSVVNAGDCVSSNGKITLFRTGGVGPYTYSIDGNTYQSSPLFTNLAPGTYDGYVKDSKTCIGVMSGIVVGPNCPPPPVAGIATRSVQAITGVQAARAKVTAYPNPSSSEFMLSLEGYGTERVTIMVTDAAGRVVYETSGVGKQQYRFGSRLTAGIYLVQVIQGTNRQQLKLVKE